MNRTGIEYIDFTSNPIIGCDMTLPCAERCWARRLAHRLKAAGVPRYQTVTSIHGGWTGKTTFAESELQALLRHRKPATVGLCFMADAFHESVPDAWLDRIFAVCALTPHLKYLILTKRSRRMREWFANLTTERMVDGIWAAPTARGYSGGWPLPNVILGVSVEDRKSLHRLDDLRATPAACRMFSAEPLLEDLGQINLDGIGWVIVGGESGPGARPMPPEWPRAIRDQCLAAGVPYFHKQNGEWSPSNNGRDLFRAGEFGDVPVGDGTHHRMFRVGKKAAGRLLDGAVWDQFPEGWER